MPGIFIRRRKLRPFPYFSMSRRDDRMPLILEEDPLEDWLFDALNRYKPGRRRE